MAFSKTARTLLASQSLAAGATVNFTELNLSTTGGALVMIRIINGGTAPSTAPQVYLYSGHATGVKRTSHNLAGDTVNASVTDIPVEISDRTMFLNGTIINGAGQPVTVEAYAQELTGV